MFQFQAQITYRKFKKYWCVTLIKRIILHPWSSIQKNHRKQISYNLLMATGNPPQLFKAPCIDKTTKLDRVAFIDVQATILPIANILSLRKERKSLFNRITHGHS